MDAGAGGTKLYDDPRGDAADDFLLTGCHRDRLGDRDQPRGGLVGHEGVIERPIPPQDVSKSIKLANRCRPAANHRVASGRQFNVLIGHDVEREDMTVDMIHVGGDAASEEIAEPPSDQ